MHISSKADPIALSSQTGQMPASSRITQVPAGPSSNASASALSNGPIDTIHLSPAAAKLLQAQGRAGDAPAFQARAQLDGQSNPQQPFGQIVSAIAHDRHRHQHTPAAAGEAPAASSASDGASTNVVAIDTTAPASASDPASVPSPTAA